MLWYSTDGTETWNQVLMVKLDIGVNGSRYFARIPKQEAGVIVEFKVSTKDIAGNTAESILISYNSITTAITTTTTTSTSIPGWNTLLLLLSLTIILLMRKHNRK